MSLRNLLSLALDPLLDAYSSKTFAPVGHHTYNLASFVSMVLGIESNKLSHDTQLRILYYET